MNDDQDMTDKNEMLIDAQKHLECLNEALQELHTKRLSAKQIKTLNKESACRLEAAILLIQAVRTGQPSERMGAAMRKAEAFDAALLAVYQP